MDSKVYVQFFEPNLKGEVLEALGSDGVFILDGRNRMDTWHMDAYERGKRMQRIHKGYCKYEIRRGTFSTFRVLASGRLD